MLSGTSDRDKIIKILRNLEILETNLNKTAPASLCIAQNVLKYLSRLQKITAIKNSVREAVGSIRKQLKCIGKNTLSRLNQKASFFQKNKL